MPSAPYDQVIVAVNAARARLNDVIKTLQPVSGNILANGQIFTQQVVNNAWRALQLDLLNRDALRLEDQTVIYSFPAAAHTDPGIQMRLDWTGTYEGTGFTPMPTLPSNLMMPLKLAERWSSQPTSGFAPMTLAVDGLPTKAPGINLQWWEWRNDGIYFIGATVAIDIWMRFALFLSDFLDQSSGQIRWFQQTIPIMYASDALSKYIVIEFIKSREDIEFDVSPLVEDAQAASKLITNREIRINQRVNLRRKPRSGRDRGNIYGGY
jgi:hypothetical protein